MFSSYDIRFPPHCDGTDTGSTISSLPFQGLDAVAVDDRSHGTGGKNAAAVLGDNDLLPRMRIPPLLMTPGSGGPEKPIPSQNSDHLL
jgi:hypothetical protein